MFNGMIQLDYVLDHNDDRHNKLHTITTQDIYDDSNICIRVEQDLERMRVHLTAKVPMQVKKASIVIDRKYRPHEKVFVNGFQSWTNGKEYTHRDRMPRISPLVTPLIKKYALDQYGDYGFVDYTHRKGEFHGFTYTYVKSHQRFDFYGSLSECHGYTIFYHRMKRHRLMIHKDVTDLTFEGTYLLFDLFHCVGDEKTVFDRYFELQQIEKPRNGKMNGWTSWYNYYQDINESIILENLEAMKGQQTSIDIFQIDDGYETYVGDWLEVDPVKFPRGMKVVADRIKEKGYKAGIWLAPFICETNSKIFKQNQHWLLRDEKGDLIHAGHNWSGFYALDIYKPEVRDYIKSVFDTVLDQWGYDMVKLDFLYAVSLVHHNNKSRGQIMCEAMEFLRECVKDKLILGCGVPLGPSFGLVDYCRIGCDVSLDWNDKWFMRLMHRERVSTKNAIDNTMFRRQLDGRAFRNDPDVFLLRENNIILSKNEKTLLGKINQLFGSLIFTSDDVRDYTHEQRTQFTEIMDKKEFVILEVDERQKGLIFVRYKEETSVSNPQEEHKVLINLGNRTITYRTITVNKKSIVEIGDVNE